MPAQRNTMSQRIPQFYTSSNHDVKGGMAERYRTRLRNGIKQVESRILCNTALSQWQRDNHNSTITIANLMAQLRESFCVFCSSRKRLDVEGCASKAFCVRFVQQLPGLMIVGRSAPQVQAAQLAQAVPSEAGKCVKKGTSGACMWHYAVDRLIAFTGPCFEPK